MHLPWPDESFDHIFVCFVLEHLDQPLPALAALKKLVRIGGSITVIEGDHGSAYFFPRSEFALKAIQCQVAQQSKVGGNALIGRELFLLLTQAGFHDVRVSPRMVYVDNSKPDWTRMNSLEFSKTAISLNSEILYERISCVTK